MADTERENGYERHAREQRAAMARLTPLQRLEWLEQAKEFVRKYQGAAARPAAPPKDEPKGE